MTKQYLNNLTSKITLKANQTILNNALIAMKVKKNESKQKKGKKVLALVKLVQNQQIKLIL